MSFKCLLLLVTFSAVVQSNEHIKTTANLEQPGEYTNIWRPKPGISWQWQLASSANTPGILPLDTSFDVELYDIDLFFTAQRDIDTLKKSGKKIVCYFSAGTWEPWRWDAMGFLNETLGKSMSMWEDEKYLDIRNIEAIGPLIKSRLDLATQRGCDGVEPDNVDTHLVSPNSTGFNITVEDQVHYLKFLSKEAHKRGLSIGLKNNLDLVADLVNWFDWAINESCNTFGDIYANCSMLKPFIDARKAVLGVEYIDIPEQSWNLTHVPAFCESMNAAGYSWLVKKQNLYAKPLYSCQTNILITDTFNGTLPLPKITDPPVGPLPKMAFRAPFGQANPSQPRKSTAYCTSSGEARILLVVMQLVIAVAKNVL